MYIMTKLFCSSTQIGKLFGMFFEKGLITCPLSMGHTVNNIYFLITITVNKPKQVLVMLQKPGKKLSHNLIVNFAVMLDSMYWNAMIKKEKQICLWINDLTKTIGSKISNTSIMPEKVQKRAKLMPKDGMSKSILFLDKM